MKSTEIENILKMKLAAMARQSKRSKTLRLDEQTLGRWMLDRIRPDIEAQLSDEDVPQTIIIEKFFDDPRAGDFLLRAIEESASELGIFQYPVVSKDDDAGAGSESVIPAVIDLRGRRRNLPKTLAAIEASDAETRHTLAIVHGAYAAGQRVVILAKRSGYVPVNLRMPETQRVSLRPLDVAELVSACGTLFETDEELRVDADDARWVSLITPCDFLENAKSADDSLLDDLYRSVKKRLSALAGGSPTIPLSQLAGRKQVKRWPLQIQHALLNSESPQERDHLTLLAGRGAVFRTETEEFGETVVQSIASEIGLNFIRVDGDDFLEDPLDWIDRADDLAPCLMHIGQGRWQHLPELIHNMQSKNKNSTEQDEVLQVFALRQRVILAELTRFSSSHPVFLTTVVPEFESLHHQFLSPDIFSRQIDAGSFTDAERGRITLHRIGSNFISPGLGKSLDKVGKLFGSRMISEVEILHLHRRTYDANRLLRFSDLIDLYFRGPADADVDTPRSDSKVTAYHEAGHALMEIINSGGKAIPDYASILPNQSIGQRFEGVVMPDIGVQSSGVMTYQQFQNQVRFALGGRAAEEILGGPEQVSNGASSDLGKATTLATMAFGNWGFSADMATGSGSNLAVLLDLWVGPGRDGDGFKADLISQRGRIAEMTRIFLQTEYAETMRLLRENGHLLDAIATRLLRTPVIGRDEIRGVLKKFPLV